MPVVQELTFSAFVVEAAFLAETAVFALGDGTVRLVAGEAETSVPVHGGAILSAMRTVDGTRLVTGGDDGLVAATNATGDVQRLAERPRKWIDHVATGPGDAVAFATGRQVTVRFADGRLTAPSGRGVEFTEAARRLYRDQKYPYALGVFPAPRVDWDESCGQGKAYFTWVYGCQAVEITVGRRTGRIRLLNAWAAHDVGRAVNRAMLLGQFYGGMAMGAGYGLFEEVAMTGGRLRSLNYDTYHIPRSTDMPEMTAIILENRDPLSPSGAKSIGEPANELMAPAIANAYYHATGRRRFELPIGGEK